MNILGIILARKGSKGIPGKNYLKLEKKNLVEIAIRNAKKSSMLNKILFSSDDKKLVNVAKSLGVSAPFLRPKNLSNDKASSFSVLKHAIEWLEKNENWKTDIVVLLQPTTPFRTGKIIDDVIKLLIRSKSNAAMTITDVDYPPHWMILMKKNKKLKTLIKNGNKFTRRQDTPQCYKPAGLVYAIRKNILYKIKGLLPHGDTRGFYISPEQSINIDNYLHYLLAKTVSKKFLK